MASEKQMVANRVNAKRSTGPKSTQGKALSRMNAYRHGLTAETIVIGDEDPRAFDRLRAQLEEEYDPRPGIESELVERLAVLMWRLRRIPTFEAALIELPRENRPSGEPVIAFQTSRETLAALFRYESSNHEFVQSDPAAAAFPAGVSSAVAPQPTPIISATRNREGLHSK